MLSTSIIHQAAAETTRSGVPAGELIYQADRLAKELVLDHNRPTWHLTPWVGHWWDVNGLMYRDGRYHAMWMHQIFDESGDRLPPNWGHASSVDLLHWQFHPDSLHSGMFEDGERRPFWSGDAIDNAPVPTIIPFVPRSGIWAAQPVDDAMLEWEFIQQEPIMPIVRGEEYIVFDPTAWYDEEEQVYYMLTGNRNSRPGYEGDSTSLMRSRDLREWEYLGPLYKSSREMPGAIPLGSISQVSSI